MYRVCTVRARACGGDGDGVRVGCGGGGVSSKSLPRRLPFLLLSAAVLLALSPSPGRRGLLCGCRTTIEKEKKCLKKYT